MYLQDHSKNKLVLSLQKKIVKIFNLKGETIGETQIPKIFETPLRQDVIKRAVLSSHSKRLQPQGQVHDELLFELPLEEVEELL